MIRFCAEKCAESYEDSLPEGFMDIEDLRFGAFEKNGMKVFVFRGSSNLMNWRRNFRMFPSKSPYGHWAHRGFIQAFRILEKSIRSEGPMLFTGHSLGAAIAHPFAEKYRAPLITFGSPRVYLRWSAPEISHKRYVCDDDPVPMVPHFLYSHAAAPIILSDRDGRRIDADDHDINVYLERL